LWWCRRRRDGRCHRWSAGDEPLAAPLDLAGLIWHASADWCPTPDHAGVGRWEDASAFFVTNPRFCCVDPLRRVHCPGAACKMERMVEIQKDGKGQPYIQWEQASATWKRLNSSPEALWVDSGVRYAFLTSRDQGSEPSKSPYGHGWRLSQGCVPGCSNRIRCCPPRGRCDLRCVHPTGSSWWSLRRRRWNRRQVVISAEECAGRGGVAGHGGGARPASLRRPCERS